MSRRPSGINSAGDRALCPRLGREILTPAYDAINAVAMRQSRLAATARRPGEGRGATRILTSAVGRAPWRSRSPATYRPQRWLESTVTQRYCGERAPRLRLLESCLSCADPGRGHTSRRHVDGCLLLPDGRRIEPTAEGVPPRQRQLSVHRDPVAHPQLANDPERVAGARTLALGGERLSARLNRPAAGIKRRKCHTLLPCRKSSGCGSALPSWSTRATPFLDSPARSTSSSPRVSVCARSQLEALSTQSLAMSRSTPTESATSSISTLSMVRSMDRPSSPAIDRNVSSKLSRSGSFPDTDQSSHARSRQYRQARRASVAERSLGAADRHGRGVAVGLVNDGVELAIAFVAERSSVRSTCIDPSDRQPRVNASAAFEVPVRVVPRPRFPLA